MEALSASARALGVGIIEHKLTFYLIIDEVHFHADHEHQRLRVDDHAYILFFNNLIQFLDLFRRLTIVQDVAVPVAATAADAQLYSI